MPVTSAAPNWYGYVSRNRNTSDILITYDLSNKDSRFKQMFDNNTIWLKSRIAAVANLSDKLRALDCTSNGARISCGSFRKKNRNSLERSETLLDSPSQTGGKIVFTLLQTLSTARIASTNRWSSAYPSWISPTAIYIRWARLFRASLRYNRPTSGKDISIHIY